MFSKKCSLQCQEYGYCQNRRNGKECGGFIPMYSEEEEVDAFEEMLERTTY